MDIQYKAVVPTKEDFFQLYETTGWNQGKYSEKDLFKAIKGF